MKFTKMHGIGNDYVYVNCFEEQVQDPEKTAVFVSDRHFGIGADGLILIKPSDTADFEMEMYNADGSRGAMCGNGIRCVAKYVYDYGLTDKTCIRVATGSGIKELTLTVQDGKVAFVRVDMGAPVFEPGLIPVDLSCCGSADREKSEGGNKEKETLQTAEKEDADVPEGEDVCVKDQSACSEAVDCPICVCGQIYRMTCVSMGNPHCVVCVDDVDGLDIEKIGPHFEHHPCFPDRVNTEFIRVLDRRTVQMRVWERGSGETWACGTGACAVAAACIRNGWTENCVTVRLRGGDLQIEWDQERNTIFMTGPAAKVFDGEI